MLDVNLYAQKYIAYVKSYYKQPNVKELEIPEAYADAIVLRKNSREPIFTPYFRIEGFIKVGRNKIVDTGRGQLDLSDFHFTWKIEERYNEYFKANLKVDIVHNNVKIYAPSRNCIAIDVNTDCIAFVDDVFQIGVLYFFKNEKELNKFFAKLIKYMKLHKIGYLFIGDILKSENHKKEKDKTISHLKKLYKPLLDMCQKSKILIRYIDESDSNIIDKHNGKSIKRISKRLTIREDNSILFADIVAAKNHMYKGYNQYLKQELKISFPDTAIILNDFKKVANTEYEFKYVKNWEETIWKRL